MSKRDVGNRLAWPSGWADNKREHMLNMVKFSRDLVAESRTSHMACVSQKLHKDAIEIYEKSLAGLPYVIEFVLENEADRKAAHEWLNVLKRAKKNGWQFD